MSSFTISVLSMLAKFLLVGVVSSGFCQEVGAGSANGLQSQSVADPESISIVDSLSLAELPSPSLEEPINQPTALSEPQAGSVIWDFRPSWINYISRGGYVLPPTRGATAQGGKYEFPGTAEIAQDSSIIVKGVGGAQFTMYCGNASDPATCILNNNFDDPMVEFYPKGKSYLTVTVSYGLSTGAIGNQQGPFTIRLATLDFSQATRTPVDDDVLWGNIDISLQEEHRIVFDNAYRANDTMGTLSFVYPKALEDSLGVSFTASPSVSSSVPPSPTPTPPPPPPAETIELNPPQPSGADAEFIWKMDPSLLESNYLFRGMIVEDDQSPPRIDDAFVYPGAQAHISNGYIVVNGVGRLQYNKYCNSDYTNRAGCSFANYMSNPGVKYNPKGDSYLWAYEAIIIYLKLFQPTEVKDLAKLDFSTATRTEENGIVRFENVGTIASGDKTFDLFDTREFDGKSIGNLTFTFPLALEQELLNQGESSSSALPVPSSEEPVSSSTVATGSSLLDTSVSGSISKETTETESSEAVPSSTVATDSGSLDTLVSGSISKETSETESSEAVPSSTVATDSGSLDISVSGSISKETSETKSSEATAVTDEVTLSIVESKSEPSSSEAKGNETTSATFLQPTESELEPTATDSQPTESELKPTGATESELEPTATDSQPAESELKPTGATESELKPTDATDTPIQSTESEPKPTEASESGPKPSEATESILEPTEATDTPPQPTDPADIRAEAAVVIRVSSSFLDLIGSTTDATGNEARFPGTAYLAEDLRRSEVPINIQGQGFLRFIEADIGIGLPLLEYNPNSWSFIFVTMINSTNDWTLTLVSLDFEDANVSEDQGFRHWTNVRALLMPEGAQAFGVTDGTEFGYVDFSYEASLDADSSPAKSFAEDTATDTPVLPSTDIVYTTTEVVTAFTTYCPEPTVLTHGKQTYTVTEATTLTITDCPCTLTHTVSPGGHSGAEKTPAGPSTVKPGSETKAHESAHETGAHKPAQGDQSADGEKSASQRIPPFDHDGHSDEKKPGFQGPDKLPSAHDASPSPHKPAPTPPRLSEGILETPAVEKGSGARTLMNLNALYLFVYMLL